MIYFRELPPHPNVLQVFGVTLDGPQPILVMEYCVGGILFSQLIQFKINFNEKSSFDCYGISGSLDKLLFDNNQPLSEREKINLVKGIARGMCHLHNHNIIHRDLAARNILLTESGQPKISVLLFLCFLFHFIDAFQYFCQSRLQN
jgi:serine/threonine protein kinase